MTCTAIWGIALGPRKRRKHGGTIDRIRKGQGITTAKLDDFCQIFHCRVEDLITYVEPADGEPHSPYSEKSPK